MSDIYKPLAKLPSYTLNKHLNHYILIIDRGISRPIIFRETELTSLLLEVSRYLERIKR